MGYAYITQALFERGMLMPGKRGLGFAVGHEPLPAQFASMGCQILATDLDTAHEQAKAWADSDQHAESLDVLNVRGICPPDVFDRSVSFRFVNMNAIPSDLGQFDFVWSSCSLEHLGSLAHGEDFVMNSLRNLKPGGVAVHTTEFNVGSNFFTTKIGGAVIYRRRDIERLAKRIGQAGCSIDLDFTKGNLPIDTFVDLPPYTHEKHLRLKLNGHIATSIGLIIEKPA